MDSRRSPRPEVWCRTAVALATVLAGAAPPALAVDPGALPEALAGGTFQGTATVDQAAKAMTVVQDPGRPKAVFDWESFNIGAGAAVHFDQQGNAGHAALNRIHDQDPSVINGRLTADGGIYLINRNGILFGQTAQVSVHSLVASALAMAEEDFLAGRLRFQGGAAPGATVENRGHIETGFTGSAILVGPNVVNSGTITSPAGEVLLIAANGVDLGRNEDGSRQVTVTEDAADPDGRATNTGVIEAPSGLAGMFGRVVNQDGIVRATTAVRLPGRIVLQASERLETGPGSVTASPIQDDAVQGPGDSGGLAPTDERRDDTPGDQTETVHEDTPEVEGSITLDAPEIAIQGKVVAPSGTITARAKTRLAVGDTGVVDVAGLWINRPATEAIITAKLNREELRDDYGQKGGTLHGQTIRVSRLEGSAIGNLEAHLQEQEETATQRAVKGGTIDLEAGTGDLLLSLGSVVDFSGGGARFAQGVVTTSRLKAGDRWYQPKDAPQWRQYDGIAEVTEAQAAFIEGADAGIATLNGRRLVLDGRLDGHATPGPYQTEAAERMDAALGRQLTRGRKEPRGGELRLGLMDAAGQDDLRVRDFGVEALEILPTLPAASQRDEGTTYLTASTINQSGVATLRLYSNTSLGIHSGVNLVLPHDGSFEAIANDITVAGAVTVPSGDIVLQEMPSRSTWTPEGGEPGRIVIAAGGSLDVAGEDGDNTPAGIEAGLGRTSCRLDGGTITIQEKRADRGHGIEVAAGAVIDVQGGVLLDPGGGVQGGDAGSLDIGGSPGPQSRIILDGELRGQAIAGKKGGEIRLWAETALLTAGAAGGGANLVLADDRLAATGFTRVTIHGFQGMEVAAGAIFGPSPVRRGQPLPGTGAADGPVSVPIEEIGVSSILLAAGDSLHLSNLVNEVVAADANVVVGAGAQLAVGPGAGSTIWLRAPDAIEVSGTLTAPGGSVRVSSGSREGGDDGGRLTLTPGAVITAQGVALPDRLPPAFGLPLGATPVDGGLVTLTSGTGQVQLLAGSLVDVAGPAPCQSYVLVQGESPQAVTAAGSAGELTITSWEQPLLEGELAGGAAPGAPVAGTVRITRTDPGASLGIAAGSGLDPTRLRQQGFDRLALASANDLTFHGAFSATDPAAPWRRIELDAPSLTVDTGDRALDLTAVSLLLTNTTTLGHTFGRTGSGGDSSLSLSARYLEVEGSVAVHNAGTVTLAAGEDLLLGDGGLYYQAPTGSPVGVDGRLGTGGDLFLEARRIFPTTYSRFTVHAGGLLTTRPSGQAPAATPILSAGADLTLEASQVVHQGFLAAPNGRITVNASGDTEPGRIYLAPDSVMSVAGQGFVPIGNLDALGGGWTADHQDKSSTPIPLAEALPDQGISLTAEEVILREGALVDASAGGTLFASQWLYGLEGSTNPLARTGRHVVLPGDPLFASGEAIALAAGAGGLAAGLYSILPDELAHLPGAMVLTDLGSSAAALALSRSQDGAPVVLGYVADRETGGRQALPHAFAVQPASVLLARGHFELAERQTMDAGQVEVTAATAILEGTIRAEGATRDEGGSLLLSGREVAVGQTAGGLPPDFRPDTRMDELTEELQEQLRDRLTLSAEALSGQGLRTLALGHLARDSSGGVVAGASTRTIEVAPGTFVDVPIIRLAATGAIDIGRTTAAAGAEAPATRLAATTLEVHSASGAVTLGQGASLAAQDLTITAQGLVLPEGTGQPPPTPPLDVAAGGRLTLTSDHLTLGSPEPATGSGLALDTTTLAGLADLGQLTLTAAGDLTLMAGLDLTLAGHATLATPLLRTAGQGDAVRLAASSLVLENPEALAAAADSGSVDLSLEARDHLLVGPGSVQVAAGQELRLAAGGSLAFLGATTLTPRLLAGGTVTLDTDLVTALPDQSAAGVLVPAQARLEAAGALVRIGDPAEPASTADATTDLLAPGGALAIVGRRIEQSSRLQIPAGQVILQATGSGPEDGIELFAGSTIDVRGGLWQEPVLDSFLAMPMAGGRVELAAGAGSVQIDPGATVDVSAGHGQDGGELVLMSPEGGVRVQGTCTGRAEGARSGGTLQVDSLAMADLAALMDHVAGFDRRLDLRARTGDLTVSTALLAQELRLRADQGDIVVAADTSAAAGGFLAVEAGGSIALGSAQDPPVTLAAAGGTMDLAAGQGLTMHATARIELGHEQGNGSLRLAAAQLDRDSDGQADDLDLVLAGTVAGAGAIVVEGVASHHFAGDKILRAGEERDGWRQEAADFMAHAGDIAGRLLGPGGLRLEGTDGQAVTVRPGLKVTATGDLTLAGAWDLSAWRFGGGQTPGHLLLAAGGDLLLQASLLDQPTDLTVFGSTPSPSWALDLAADGDLTVANATKIYTESAAVSLRAGQDLVIGALPAKSSSRMVQTQLVHNIGSFDGPVRVETGGSLTLAGGAIQTATGAIAVRVGGDLTLARGTSGTTVGSIRTTGQPGPEAASQGDYLRYAGGGDIDIQVAGGLMGVLNPAAWDSGVKVGRTPPHLWTASFSGSPGFGGVQGLATMAGGDLTVTTGRSLFAQAGTFGEGNLTISARGDVNGRFLVDDGAGSITAMGSFGTGSEPTPLELAGAVFRVAALGDVRVGAIINPANTSPQVVTLPSHWNLAYSPEAAVELTAVRGSVTLTGRHADPAYQTGAAKDRLAWAPPFLSLMAGQDVLFETAELRLSPSGIGGLSILAGGDVAGTNAANSTFLREVDVREEEIYRRSELGGVAMSALGDGTTHHLIHDGDATPVSIRAGGDLRRLRLDLAEPAAIEARGSIRDVGLTGIHYRSDQITRVQAGADLSLRPDRTIPPLAFLQFSGPGAFVVQAGGNLDLGLVDANRDQGGINATGNTLFSDLPSNPALLLVGAGIPVPLDPAATRLLLDQLLDAATAFTYLENGLNDPLPGSGDVLTIDDWRAMGEEFAQALEGYASLTEVPAEERKILAGKAAALVREQLVRPLLGDGSHTGDLTMTSTRIRNESQGGALCLLAAGDLEVGRSVRQASASANPVTTGILCPNGGDIAVLTSGAIDVNEARVVAGGGGDIMLYSDQSNINAGLGARTAVSGQGDMDPLLDANGQKVADLIRPPAVGSGVQSPAPSDPDTALGPKARPEAGLVSLFAPAGIIDAGEGGRAGGRGGG
ncbi:MAG: filamentous hemagglutinin N-terminal domain-containing protein, partial [Thermodesulfobacteriota bacterium]